jgi:hypothetical protein
MPRIISLREAYRFPGFHPAHQVRVEPEGFVVTLVRRRKKVFAVAVDEASDAFMIRVRGRLAIWIARIDTSFWSSPPEEFFALGAA